MLSSRAYQAPEEDETTVTQPPPGQPDFQPQPPYQPPQGQANQQPYQGQPNQQPNQGQPNQQPYQGSPQDAFQQQPKKRSSVRKVLSGIVTVAVLGAGGYFMWQRFTSDAALKVGNCITVKGDSNDDVDHKQVKCDDAGTYSYYVAEVHSGKATCTDGISYESTSSRRGNTKTTKTTCLIPQFAAGTCYKAVDESVYDYSVADCASADFKVTSVENTSSATCSAPSEPASFEVPARTYCIEWKS